MQRFLAYGPLPVRAPVRASRSLEERSVFDVQQRQAEVGSALFYEKLEPLSIKDHGHLGVSLTANPYAFLAETHAVPITADEFQYAAVCYPIVFTREAKVPVVLMGPNPGTNVFIAQDGEMDPEAYVPAYVQRYPFLPVSTGPLGRLPIGRRCPSLRTGSIQLSPGKRSRHVRSLKTSRVEPGT